MEDIKDIENLDMHSLKIRVEQGDDIAKYVLAMKHIDGNSEEIDLKTAGLLLKDVAYHGLAIAKSSLATWWYGPEVVSVEDMNISIRLYGEAAAQGDSCDLFELTDIDIFPDMLDLGIDASILHEAQCKAASWYRKMAELGHTDAEFGLGWCYANGIGVDKDIAKALQWYHEAAEVNYDLALYQLGLCYMEGHGVTKDSEKACSYFQKAADEGVKAARDILHEINLEDSNTFLDSEEEDNSATNQVVKSGNGLLPSLTAVKWLIGVHSIENLGVIKQIGTTGAIPYPEQSFCHFLQELGFETLYPGKDTSIVVVGQESLEMSKLEECIDLRYNLTTKIYSQEMFLYYLMSGKDPFDAEIDVLMEFGRGHPILENLMEHDFKWPAVRLTPGDSEPPDGLRLTSPLTEEGYHVGKIRGESVQVRRKTLSNIMKKKHLKFPSDYTDAEKMDWGMPNSSKRLEKIARRIAFDVNTRSKQYSMRYAVKDWENDLQWLKKTYYGKTNSKFSWPGV